MNIRSLCAILFLAFLIVAPQYGYTGVQASAWVLTRGTPLMQAAYKGDYYKVVELVRKRSDVSEKNRYGATPLIYAAYKGNEKIVEYLIGKGAEVNACASYNMCPLWFAVNSSSLATVKLLLESGANAKEVPEGNSLENSPLILAVAKGQQVITKMLIKHGAEVGLENWRTGGTALTTAVAQGEGGLVTVLLDSGADPAKTLIQLPYYNNISPLDYAKEMGHSDAVKIIEDRLRHKKYQNRVLTVDNIITRLYKDKQFVLEEVHDVIKYVTKGDLRLIKNTLFARKNYKFDSEDLLTYYKGRFKSYTPLTKKVKLSDIDRRNLDYVKRMKKYISDRDAAG